jgi:hypothetical protein
VLNAQIRAKEVLIKRNILWRDRATSFVGGTFEMVVENVKEKERQRRWNIVRKCFSMGLVWVKCYKGSFE